jgi:cytoskeletal protein CcmA (bactofilin family)
MFSKETKLDKFKDAETIIGASIKVKGNFQGQGNIVIEGSLEGSLKTNANLFIGEKAKVVANIEAKDAIVNGEMHGNLKTKGYLAIGGSAKIFGDIQYGELSVEKGAIINGQLLGLSDNSRKESRKEEKIEEEK